MPDLIRPRLEIDGSVGRKILSPFSEQLCEGSGETFIADGEIPMPVGAEIEYNQYGAALGLPKKA